MPNPRTRTRPSFPTLWGGGAESTIIRVRGNCQPSVLRGYQRSDWMLR